MHIPLPDCLRGVPRATLEVCCKYNQKRTVVLTTSNASLLTIIYCHRQDYVLGRLRQFSKVFAGQLVPNASEQSVDHAFQRALNALGANESESALEAYRVRFRHTCK